MKLMITGKYLLLPVNTASLEKTIVFRNTDGEIAMDYVVPLDATMPKFETYIHVARFVGQEFDVQVSPKALFSYRFADQLPEKNVYPCRRPFVHYTPRVGWLSDPNGLFFSEGNYHMFYQYNPVSTKWGNMHWGHAVSHDLMHWEEREEALYPDENGAVFSGSAYVDSENRSGLAKNREDPAPILLYYTAAGGVSAQSWGKNFTQCLAYSLDAGKTFIKYDKNPILERMTEENRDPKVTYAPEADGYIMVLYMEENQYALFLSKDLFTWKKWQTLSLYGEYNCPDFYPMTDSCGERFWILSGGQNTYTVGKLTKKGFFPMQNTRSYYFGKACSCVGQTFSFPGSVQSGSLYERRIRMMYEKTHVEDAPFENQMGIPTEISLVKVGDIYRLCSMPVREIETLYSHTKQVYKMSVTPEKPFCMYLTMDGYDITFRSSGGTWSADETGEYRVTVFGITLQVCPGKNKLKVVHHNLEEIEMPLSYRGEEVDVRFIVDVAGVEIFADRGLVYAACAVPADFGMAYIKVETDVPMLLDELTVHALRASEK